MDDRNSFHNYDRNNASNQYSGDEETINMVKIQNRKIQELYEEIEKREQKIQTLQSQVNGVESYKYQMENYKRQVVILEEKLRLYENDITNKSSFLSEQLRQVSDAENKLRNQIINKDKIIHELDCTIKDQDNTITSFKKHLMEKDEINNNLKQDFNDISSKLKNIIVRMDTKEDEFRRVREEYDNRIRDMSNEKHHLEDKLAQLIDIVKQYSKELNEYNFALQNNETEFRGLKKINERLEDDIRQLNRNNKELQENILKLKETEVKLNDAQVVIHSLEGIIEADKVKFENSLKTNKELSDKNKQLKDRLTNEDNLKNIVESQKSDLNELNINYEKALKNNKSHENKLKEIETENRDIINFLNSEFKSMIQWIETYFNSFYDYSIDIPELPQITSKQIKSKIKLDNLKETLYVSRKRVSDEITKFDKINKELKKEISENITKFDRLKNEINNLKNELINKNEEIYSITHEMEDYQKNIMNNKENFDKLKSEIEEIHGNYSNMLQNILNITKQEFDSILQNDNLKSFHEFINRKIFEDNLLALVDNNVDKLIQLLNALIKEYENHKFKNDEYQRLKLENDKLKKDFSDKSKFFKDEIEKQAKDKDEAIKFLEKSKIEEIHNKEQTNKYNIDKMKSKLNEKDDLIMQIQQENILLRSQLDMLEKNIKLSSSKEEVKEYKDRYDKLNESYKALEKKYRNILTDLELKDIQLKSQEQMINRRSQEINEIKNRFDGSVIKLSLKQETEKDKLRDNINLTNTNNSDNQFNYRTLSGTYNDKSYNEEKKYGYDNLPSYKIKK